MRYAVLPSSAWPGGRKLPFSPPGLVGPVCGGRQRGQYDDVRVASRATRHEVNSFSHRKHNFGGLYKVKRGGCGKLEEDGGYGHVRPYPDDLHVTPDHGIAVLLEATAEWQSRCFTNKHQATSNQFGADGRCDRGLTRDFDRTVFENTGNAAGRTSVSVGWAS